MKKRILLNILLCFITANILFAGDIIWTGGGVAGDWEDPANWDKNRVPDDGDDVFIIGAYTVTLESNPTIEALRLENGAHLIIAATYTLTVFDNSSDGVRIENTGGTLTVNGTLNSYEHSGYGVKIDSVGAVMTINGTLNSHDNNDDGVRLDGPGSIMTVNGTINSYNNSKDGIEVKNGNSLIIPSSGKIYLNNNGDDGIDLAEDVTNDGLISITNPTDVGLNTGGSGYFVNNGSITVSGGKVSIDGKGTSWFFTNNGTISLSNADTSLVDDGTNIFNYGTFKGDGKVENGNNFDVDFKPGSILEPGTSIGLLSFTDILDLTGVNINIEINGVSNYDQIFVDTGFHAPADVTISGAHLNLSGTYTPVAGDEFMIIEKISPGAITGTFNGLSEGATFTYKGVDLMITYTGGDGNDMTLTSLGALPIELIDFSARALKSDVKLEWSTATETNNDFFTIERSQDGRTFEEIATILGNGNTTEISKYIHMDRNPLSGLNYYRLKQTDFDGQFSYSEIETVEFRNEIVTQIYPTLVTDILTIETAIEKNAELTIVIRDLTGRIFQLTDIQAKENRKEIQLIDLLPGNYFITIYNNEAIETFKFIKL